MPARIWEASAGRAFVLLLEKGDDLLAEVERICAEYEVGVAWVSAIGAVRRASFGYYQQGPKSYVEMTSDRHTMLNGFVGNISVADGRPFLHAHASFSAVDGSTRRRAPAARLRGLRGRGHDPRDDRPGARAHNRRGDRSAALVDRAGVRCWSARLVREHRPERERVDRRAVRPEEIDPLDNSTVARESEDPSLGG